jgi:hypothetical protein
MAAADDGRPQSFALFALNSAGATLLVALPGIGNSQSDPVAQFSVLIIDQ